MLFPAAKGWTARQRLPPCWSALRVVGSPCSPPVPRQLAGAERASVSVRLKVSASRPSPLVSPLHLLLPSVPITPHLSSVPGHSQYNGSFTTKTTHLYYISLSIKSLFVSLLCLLLPSVPITPHLSSVPGSGSSQRNGYFSLGNSCICYT